MAAMAGWPSACSTFPGIDIFLMEYDSPRAGDFSPLKHLPKGKTVILGLISSKSAALEDKETIKRRIGEAEKFAPLDQLGISPQCGFATNLTGSPLTLADERAKLSSWSRSRARCGTSRHESYFNRHCRGRRAASCPGNPFVFENDGPPGQARG